MRHGSSRRPALLPLVAVAVFAAGTAARAQSAGPPQDEPGDFAMLAGQDEGHLPGRIPAAQRAQAQAVLARVADVLRRDPAVASPRGYAVRAYRLFNYVEQPLAPGVIMSYDLEALLLPWMVDDRTGKLFHRQNSSGMGFDVDVNDVRCLLREAARDGDGAIYTLRDERLDPHGRDPGDPEVCLLVTRGDRPLWLPVSRERFLRAAIARSRVEQDSAVRRLQSAVATSRKPSGMDNPDFRKAYEAMKQHDPAAAEKFRQSMEEMQAKLVPAVQQQAQSSLADSANTVAGRHLRALEAELAGLSAAERAQPAWADSLWYRNPSALGRPGQRGAHQVVQINPDYFDRSLPPAAPQLIVVETRAAYQSGPWMAAIRRGLDVQALRALLRP